MKRKNAVKSAKCEATKNGRASAAVSSSQDDKRTTVLLIPHELQHTHRKEKYEKGVKNKSRFITADETEYSKTVRILLKFTLLHCSLPETHHRAIQI